MANLDSDDFQEERNKRQKKNKRERRKKRLKTLTKKFIKVSAYPFVRTKRKIDNSIAYVFQIEFLLSAFVCFFIWINLKNADKLEKDKEKLNQKTEELHKKFDSKTHELHQKVSDTRIELKEVEARVQWRNAQLQAFSSNSTVQNLGVIAGGISLFVAANKLIPLKKLVMAPLGVASFLRQSGGRDAVVSKAENINKQLEIKSNDEKAALQKNREIYQQQQNKLQKLQKKLDEQQNEIEILKNNLRQRKQDNKDMAADVQTLMSTLKKSYTENSKLQQKQDELAQSNLEKKNAIQTSQNNLVRLENARENLQKQIEQAAGENTQLKQKLNRSYLEANTSRPNLMLQHSNRKGTQKNSSEFKFNWQRKKKKKSQSQNPTAFTGFDGQSTPTARISSSNKEQRMLWEDSVVPKRKPSLFQRIVKFGGG